MAAPSSAQSAESRRGVILLMAFAPAHIYWTATAHTESVFTAVALGTIAAVTVTVQRDEPPGAGPWLAVGALVGAAVLVRSPGLLLLAVPALALRAQRGRWVGSLRASGLVLAGAVVVLAPWGVRNGLQVGVWTPTSTGNAAALCAGHHELAEPYFNPDPELEADCFRHHPLDDESLGLGPPGWDYGGPDEARWYREASARGIRWALAHPIEEVGLAARKFAHAWRDDYDAVPGARNFSEGSDWPGRATFPLGLAANLWLWGVQALALAGLALVPACRRALPIWGPVLIVTVMIMATLSFPHYRHPAIPLLVVLASGFLASGWWRSRMVESVDG